jgi:hypothetical protein
MIRNGPVVSPAPRIDSMPGKRKGRVSSLDPETRRRIEDVHAGRSTMLWLAGGGSDDLMEVLEAI